MEGDGAAISNGSGSKMNGKLASPLKERSKQSKKMTVNTGKVYESDKESGNVRGTYSSDGGYFDADDDSESDEDQFENAKSTPSCCSCFGVFGSSDKTPDATPGELRPEFLQKPHGLFGQKSFGEVCMEIAESDNFGGLENKQNYGLISCIVKSGDDLKQE